MTRRPKVRRDVVELLAADARSATESDDEALLALRVAYATLCRKKGLQVSAVDDRMDKERRFHARARP